MLVKGQTLSPTTLSLPTSSSHSDVCTFELATWNDRSMVCRVVSRIERAERASRAGASDRDAACGDHTVSIKEVAAIRQEVDERTLFES
jgi:hypothetical protein